MTNVIGTFVTVRTGGCQYRRQLNAASPSSVSHKASAGSSKSDISKQSYPNEQYKPIPQLAEVGLTDFISELNETTTRKDRSVISLAVGIFVSIVVAAVSNPALLFLGFVITACVFFVSQKSDLKRQTFALFYEFGDEASEHRWRSLCLALQNAAQSQSMWRVNAASTKSLPTPGAPSNQSLIKSGAPHRIATNVTPYSIDLREEILYFLPDGLYLRVHGKFQMVGYDQLRIDITTVRVTEHGPKPADAEVIGSVWQHARKDGGPDQRFKYNRQLPIVKYGQISLLSNTGLNICLQSSSISSLAGLEYIFKESTSQRAGSESLLTSGSRPVEKAADPMSPDALAAILGVSATASPSEIGEAHHRLSRSYYPNLLTPFLPEFRCLAEERLRQINHTYAEFIRLSPAAQVQKSAAPIIHAPVPAAITPSEPTTEDTGHRLSAIKGDGSEDRKPLRDAARQAERSTTLTDTHDDASIPLPTSIHAKPSLLATARKELGTSNCGDAPSSSQELVARQLGGEQPLPTKELIRAISPQSTAPGENSSAVVECKNEVLMNLIDTLTGIDKKLKRDLINALAYAARLDALAGAADGQLLVQDLVHRANRNVQSPKSTVQETIKNAHKDTSPSQNIAPLDKDPYNGPIN